MIRYITKTKWIETDELTELDIPSEFVLYRTEKGNYIGVLHHLISTWFHITEETRPELWELIQKHENPNEENQL